MTTELHEARDNQPAIAHLSFVDDDGDVVHEALVENDFEWNVDELIELPGEIDQPRLFAVAQVYAVYIDDHGLELPLDIGSFDPSSLLVVLVTCERVPYEAMSDARASIRASTAIDT